MRRKVYYWLGGILAIFILILSILIYIPWSESSSQQKVLFSVDSCSHGRIGYGAEVLDNNTFTTFVNTNCCGTNISIEKVNDTYVIREVKYGEICKCFCPKKISIYNFVRGSKVVFIDWSGDKKYIYNGTKEFCGRSTYGKCKTDEDCVIDGCSGQVCRSKEEGKVMTTCEWLDCYDYKKFGYECGCVEGKCQWVKK